MTDQPASEPPDGPVEQSPNEFMPQSEPEVETAQPAADPPQPRPDRTPGILPPPTIPPADADAAAGAADPGDDGARDGDPLTPSLRLSWLRLLGTSRAGALIGVLCALLGFALVAQVRSTSSTAGLAGARQEDLVRILDDLTSREERLRRQIGSLEAARGRLTTSGGTSSAALAEARTRSTALGILAGTVAAQGPGVRVTLRDPQRRLTAEDLLDAVEELRAAGAEAIEVGGVRIGLDSAFVDGAGGIELDGHQLAAPYVLVAIGEPATLATALGIPGGVVDTTRAADGQTVVEQQRIVVIRALRPLPRPAYAQPSDGGG